MKTNYSYIDITEKDDIISYMKSNKEISLGEHEIDMWNHPNRKEIKIGKLIHKLYPDKYDEQTLENFINLYKSIIRENKIYFKIFKGKNIINWYNWKNTTPKGTLSKSCMRYERCLNYLNLYTSNPEKIFLLVLFEKNNPQIIGRALLWKLDDDRMLMDRIYTANDSDKNNFIRYSIDNGIFLTKNDDDKYGINNINIELKPFDYTFYPFLDTLDLYQPENGIISDTIKYMDKEKKIYILDDVFGGHREHEI